MDGVQAVSWSEAWTLAHTTINLHRRFCRRRSPLVTSQLCCLSLHDQKVLPMYMTTEHTAWITQCHGPYCMSIWLTCVHLCTYEGMSSRLLQRLILLSALVKLAPSVCVLMAASSPAGCESCIVSDRPVPSKLTHIMLSTIAADVNYLANKLYTDAGKPECSCKVSMRCG